MKKKHYLLLLAGSPATGKTYLTNLIKELFPDMLVVTPDEGKELYAEAIGFDSLAEKAALEQQVWQFYYGVMTLYMAAGKQVILSEYPFSEKQKPKLTQLAQQYEYEVITIRLYADFDVLWQRRQARDLEPDRHLSHIMTHYHYGDTLTDRTAADNHITKDAFKQIIEGRRYNEFQLGETFAVDVSDFSKVDYSSLLKHLQERIIHAV